MDRCVDIYIGMYVHTGLFIHPSIGLSSMEIKMDGPMDVDRWSIFTDPHIRYER